MPQHRARKTYSRWRWLPAVAALLLVGSSAVVLTTVYATPPSSGAACPTLRVVTAHSFAPVLKALAPAACGPLDITVADGRGAAARAAALDADLWVPDDAAWRGAPDRLALADAPTAGAGAVLATSPLYLVTDRGTAAQISKAGGGWSALVGLVTAPASRVRLVAHEPGGSGDGLLALGAIGEAVWLTDGMDASADALSVAYPRTRVVPADAQAVPGRTGEVELVTERELSTATTTGLTILAPTDHTAQLRYSWFPSAAAAADPGRAKALDALRAALGGPTADRALAEAGLRRPDGARPPGPSDGDLPPVAAPPFDVLAPHHVDHVLATAYAEDRRADLVVAVDVSGSMRALVPHTSEPRIALVRRSVTTLAQLLPDDARLSLWEFGSHLAGSNDYRVLRTGAALGGDGREAVDRAVTALTPTDTGTGLHDTILAAYRSAQAAYRDGTPSHAVVFTDGRNEADNPTLSLDQLRDALKTAADPRRPVNLAVITFGAEPDATALQKAVDPVGGYVDRLSTADEVGAAFIHLAAGGLHG